MKLTSNFSLAELIASQTAARRGIDNTPPPEVLAKLRRTAEEMERVRSLLGVPIIVSSGYRSPKLNAAVGGSARSQHMLGEAVDFIAPGFGTPRAVVEKIVASDLPYDQVIVEFGRWVHISFVDGKPRRQALVIDGDGTRAFA